MISHGQLAAELGIASSGVVILRDILSPQPIGYARSMVIRQGQPVHDEGACWYLPWLRCSVCKDDRLGQKIAANMGDVSILLDRYAKLTAGQGGGQSHPALRIVR